MISLLVLGASIAHARSSTPALSEADAAWLRQNPEVLVSYDPTWIPFSYRDAEGRLSGLDADILSELGRRLPVRIIARHAQDWADAYALALAGEVQVLTSTARTPEREPHFLFTRPYASFPLAIVARPGDDGIRELADLSGRRVAAVRGYATTLTLRREYPEIELVECGSIAEAFRLVAAERADAVVTNLVNASHVLRQEGIGNLRVAGLGPETFQLRFAVRRDHPELHRALDAAIASLTMEDRQALIAPYVRLESDALSDWRHMARRFATAGLVLMLIGAAVTWHNLRLRDELRERQRLQNELEKSHRRLEALNEEKSGLLRMAAHDLRNPLTSLIMSLEIARVGDPAAREHAYRLMDEQARRMHRLIQNLLDVEAIEGGRRELRRDRIAARDVVGETLAALEPAARRKQILLRAPEGDAWMCADRDALRQICDNLVSNAVKYSPAGATVRVQLQTTAESTTRLIVKDEGPGIPPGEHPRLFQKFARLTPRPTGGEPSTGLGLAIVKELAERMRGRVWCDSTPGHGATFYVELPAFPSSAAV